MPMAWIRKPRQVVSFSNSEFDHYTEVINTWEQSLQQCFSTPTSSPTQGRKQWKLCRTDCFHPISYAGWAIQECKHCSPGDLLWWGQKHNLPGLREKTAWTYWKKAEIMVESCRRNQNSFWKQRLGKPKNSDLPVKLLYVHAW